MKYVGSIEKFREELKQRIGDKLTALIVYGSCANGTPDEFSDIDLCVIVKDKNAKTLDEIRKSSKTVEKRPFVVVIDEKEFERNIRAGDVFYKHEVLQKGKISYERDEYVSRLQDCMKSMEADFELNQEIQKERYNYEKIGFMCEMENALERLVWCFSDLVYFRLAQTQKEPQGVEEVPFLMESDEILMEYATDFIRIRDLYKTFRHRRGEFPFEELGRFVKRLQQMEDEIFRSVSN